MYADGGVRYGADVVKLLALGVRAVGVGRPFMYANIWGTEGVTRAIQLLKTEIGLDAANMGVASLKNIDPNTVSSPSVAVIPLTALSLFGVQIIYRLSQRVTTPWQSLSEVEPGHSLTAS